MHLAYFLIPIPAHSSLNIPADGVVIVFRGAQPRIPLIFILGLLPAFSLHYLLCISTSGLGDRVNLVLISGLGFFLEALALGNYFLDEGDYHLGYLCAEVLIGFAKVFYVVLELPDLLEEVDCVRGDLAEGLLPFLQEHHPLSLLAHPLALLMVSTYLPIPAGAP